MPNNYILLETIALTQSAASVTFDNLPTSGYTDLKIVASARTTVASNVEGSSITFNGSNTYATRFAQGDGGSASSGTQTILNALLFNGANATANTFGNSEMYIPNYRSTNQKSVSGDGVSENNATQAFAGLFAASASLTSAITSITIAGNNSGSFVAGSIFSLYGIAALGTTPVLAPKATGGNIVANDGTYWYHAFTSSGNFVPQVGLTADVLVVAGGGGGAYDGGGGGAGGVLGFASQSLSIQNYNCTIGAGGTGGLTLGSPLGTNGVDSQFAALTLVKGGGYGGSSEQAPTNFPPNIGGSGGGGARYNTPAQTGAAGISGQGNAGGNGVFTAPQYGAGGGGGKGTVGSNGTSTAGGAGGAGTDSVTNWGALSSVFTATNLGVSGFIGGGGGGGTYVAGTQGVGGSGGGGNGSTSATAGTAGTANTGGGGGAGAGATNLIGRSGGSGVILIRYPIA
jgi:hypothetical protein